MNITDFVTQISNKEDVPFLRIPLFDVNMRLFRSSEHYRTLILSACSYIRWLALTKMEGYTQPFGMSGANAAVPFNIIAVVHERGTSRANANILINPHIVRFSKETRMTRTNCGSIRLPEPIKVRRALWVDVSYFTEQGNECTGCFRLYNTGATVQHEIEHNKGILITDLEVRDEEPLGSIGEKSFI